MQPVRIEILLDDRASQGVARARINVSGLSDDTKKANKDMEELNKTTRSMDKTFRRLAGAFALFGIYTIHQAVSNSKTNTVTKLGWISLCTAVK